MLYLLTKFASVYIWYFGLRCFHCTLFCFLISAVSSHTLLYLPTMLYVPRLHLLLSLKILLCIYDYIHVYSWVRDSSVELVSPSTVMWILRSRTQIVRLEWQTLSIPWAMFLALRCSPDWPQISWSATSARSAYLTNIYVLAQLAIFFFYKKVSFLFVFIVVRTIWHMRSQQIYKCTKQLKALW